MNFICKVDERFVVLVYVGNELINPPGILAAIVYEW